MNGDACANPLAELHLCGGALLFWADFAPYVERVGPEMFSDAELLYLWRACVHAAGDIARVPPALQGRAIEAVDAYNGASPCNLLAELEAVPPRRRLLELGAEIIRRVGAGIEIAEIVTYIEDSLKDMETANG
jgi:hypothetical protein